MEELFSNKSTRAAKSVSEYFDDLPDHEDSIQLAVNRLATEVSEAWSGKNRGVVTKENREVLSKAANFDNPTRGLNLDARTHGDSTSIYITGLGPLNLKVLEYNSNGVMKASPELLAARKAQTGK
jgi:hypothetical protein